MWDAVIRYLKLLSMYFSVRRYIHIKLLFSREVGEAVSQLIFQLLLFIL